MSTPLDYSTGIMITFDKPIMSEPEIQTGITPNVLRNVFAPLSSSDYNTTNSKDKAFDKNDSTYWRGSSSGGPEWIGADLGSLVNVTKCRIHTGSIYRPKTYIIEGSADGTSWNAVAAGDLANTTGWQEVAFTGAAYRYWRAYFTAPYTTYFAVRDIEFYGTDIVYSTSGFLVSGNRYAMSPEGASESHNYIIKRITKTEDNLSVIIWLALTDRLKYPDGYLTVSYDKTSGNLVGTGSAQVESFSLSFLPEDFTILFNPHDLEKIALSLTQENEIIRIYYSSFQMGTNETITASLSQANEIIHVDDLEQ